jgi:hypothetical protein
MQKDWSVVQVVEFKWETLSSNSSTAKTKNLLSNQKVLSLCELYLLNLAWYFYI